MQDLILEAFNRMNIPISDGTYEDSAALRVLWLSAFCSKNKDSLNFRPHNHTFFEVHFITQGHIVYRFDDCEISIDEGKFLLIPPHSIHSISENSDDFRKMTLSFEVAEDSDLFGSLINLARHAHEIGEDIETSLDYILRRYNSKQPYADSILRSRVVEIIYLMASVSTYRPSNHSPGSYYDTRLLKAKKFIEDNPQIFLTCEEVAQCCRLSTKQLGRLFLQYEGCSLFSFIHGQKIEAAKKMIRESDDLLESISESLGFSSVNYFGKFFFRCTGLTPGEYRRSCRKKTSYGLQFPD